MEFHYVDSGDNLVLSLVMKQKLPRKLYLIVWTESSHRRRRSCVMSKNLGCM